MKPIVRERTQERASVAVVYIVSYSSSFFVDTILKPLFRYFGFERGTGHDGQVADETHRESKSTTKLILNMPSTTGADTGITSEADDAFQVKLLI